MDVIKQRYVPVLRWKRAEWIALRRLRKENPGETRAILPLFELVPQSFIDRKTERDKPLDEAMAAIIEDILINWGSNRFFIDAWLLGAARLQNGVLDNFCANSRANHLRLIPVVRLEDGTAKIHAANLASDFFKEGIGLRLLVKDINSTNVINDLAKLLGLLSVEIENIDLIIDYQFISSTNNNFRKIIQCVPHIPRWRSLTVLAGAFPSDLRDVNIGQQYLPRTDWIFWRDQVWNNHDLPREVNYGDYTIQHPIFSIIDYPPNFSASIRYTVDEQWLIMRGRSAKAHGFDQWPANAQLLALNDDFRGAKFSYGDWYIQQKGDNLGTVDESNGSAETWLRAGINHHLVFMVRQLEETVGISVVG